MSTAETHVIEFDDVRAAAERLDGVVHRTPVFTSRTLDELLGAKLFCKAESFQRTGSFKFRGAYNALAAECSGARSPARSRSRRATTPRPWRWPRGCSVLPR